MKKLVLLLLVSINTSTYAGFNGLTAHSRANCVTINESISWDATRESSTYRLWTKGSHFYKGAKKHELNTGANYEQTWRSAVLHLGEGMGDWRVVGEHWIYWPYDGQQRLFKKTDVSNCAVYDGWWDRDHPERRS